MERLLFDLIKIGISPDIVDKIREQKDREAALLLLMLYDDRREYVD